MDKTFNRTPLAASGSVSIATAGTIPSTPALQTSPTSSISGVIKFETDALASTAGTLSDDYQIQTHST